MAFITKHKTVFITIAATVIAVLGLQYAGLKLAMRGQAAPKTETAEVSFDKQLIKQGRGLLARENPRILARIASGGAFGGKWSNLAATQMLKRDQAIVDDIIPKTDIEKIAERIWLIRLPIVNVAVVETDTSLVLIDSGYASAGPVIKEKLKQISDKPVSHIFISHYHIDHAFGAWAFMDQPNPPQIVGQKLLRDKLIYHVEYGGTLAHYTNQQARFQPQSIDELVLPTLEFDDRLVLEIGGETFELYAARGETEDQHYVWMPERQALFTADYYQGFLPNAGNGKREQRHLEEWAEALRHMASLKPAHLVPMHNAAISDTAEIQRVLNIHADALQHPVDYVRERLNKADRQDRIVADYKWPPHFEKSGVLTPQYVRPEDFVRMEMRLHTGWWNDIPSHYYAQPFEAEAEEVVRMAGGVDAVVTRGRELSASNPAMAARLADWAVYAAPESALAHQFAVDIYVARIMAGDTPTQEILVYFDAAARSRAVLANMGAN